MKIVLGILSLFVVCISCGQIPAYELITPRSDVSLAKYLLKNQAQVRATDPTLSTLCFGIYLPQLQDVANQWSIDYNACVGNASDERSAILALMKVEQANISDSASGVCGYIDSCQAIDDPLDFFNCFSVLGQNIIGTVYSISNNASDDAVFLRQQLELIDTNLYRCTNASERVYVEQTARVYDALDYCLQHGPPLVSSTSTTSTTTTTAVPITVTDAPTTVVSEETATPSDTTNTVFFEDIDSPGTTLAIEAADARDVL